MHASETDNKLDALRVDSLAHAESPSAYVETKKSVVSLWVPSLALPKDFWASSY